MNYLSTPYSHPMLAVREARYRLAMQIVHNLYQERGLILFSPIVYYHPMSLRHKMPEYSEWWARIDNHFLDNTVHFYLAQMPDWETSSGILREHDYFYDRQQWHHEPEDSPPIFLIRAQDWSADFIGNYEIIKPTENPWEELQWHGRRGSSTIGFTA